MSQRTNTSRTSTTNRNSRSGRSTTRKTGTQGGRRGGTTGRGGSRSNQGRSSRTSTGRNRSTATSARGGRSATRGGNSGRTGSEYDEDAGNRKTGTKRGGENAITLLEDDHKKVRKLLKQLTEAEEADEIAALFEEVELELRVHARVEEELFYPAYHQAVTDEEDEEIYYEAAEEHESAERVLEKLVDADFESPEACAQCKVLKDLVEHLADEEEDEMFSVARKEIGNDELKLLGQRMMERKQELMAEGIEALREHTRAKLAEGNIEGVSRQQVDDARRERMDYRNRVQSGNRQSTQFADSVDQG